MDSNGYNPSLFPTEQGVCYLCSSRTDTARHEVFYGVGRRAIAKKLGLWINVCPQCHDICHKDKSTIDCLHVEGQIRFMENGGTVDQWMDLKTGIGRNYIEDFWGKV